MIERYKISTLALAVATTMAFTQAHAQEQSDSSASKSDVKPISEWNYDEIYERGGFLANRLMGIDAIGESDEDIGNIVNAVLDEQNQIVALIAEVGGLWGIGGTHVIVPWDQAELIDEGVRIPVNEDNVDDYDLYGENSALTKEDLQDRGAVEPGAETGDRTWKLSELINDYASIESGAGYGYVDNVVFSEEGELMAVIVMPSGGAFTRGATAYPFHGFQFGWHPGMTSYELPYTEEDVSQMTTFDYQEFDGRWDDS
ncbi:PRC-barrel domain-containing protein [Litchfieldella xinjiangensis]|uniref:PRC-barrel domain-containing protein n=1 Tax=Litchfieldella xinjiangensis TaxID=1166948 RepID=UPI000693C0BA|nr:PRC-barrel domain-containing protein [Halomonas xinjiangensis]